MRLSLDRRSFLHHSAVLGGSLLTCSSVLDRASRADPARIEAPVIDQLTVREITDGTHDIFLRPADLPGLTVRRTGFPEAPQGKTLESEWGLALHLESRKGEETRRYLLDFGFTPDVYANNLDLLKIDVGQVDALIISHGHYDHIGGLMGFLEERRARMRKDLRLYTGGEDNFCRRFSRNSDGSFTAFGTPLDRRRLKALDVQPVLSEVPIVIEEHAFTTGAVPRTSIEHV
ncbi:MAG: MBL fold metallo-hydrolase, partial [Acetobacteraceae bacterium]|nr:MBL fold metallo-hydrolase [Acetobacteraceae bacterium]